MIIMIKSTDIEEFFDELAVDRDEKIREDAIVDYEQRLRQFFIKELLSIESNNTILDAGSGDCRDARVFLNGVKNLPGRYIALDLSRKMLFEGVKKKQPRFIHLLQGDLTSIPLGEGTVDKIICSEVLEHIPDWGGALRELFRVLKNEGEIIISTPNKFSVYYPQKSVLESKDKSSHPYDEWKSYWILKTKLREIGFKIISTRGSGFLPGLIAYRGIVRKIFEKRLNIIERFETNAIGRSPIRYFGYIIIIKAIKKR